MCYQWYVIRKETYIAWPKNILYNRNDLQLVFWCLIYQGFHYTFFMISIHIGIIRGNTQTSCWLRMALADRFPNAASL